MPMRQGRRNVPKNWVDTKLVELKILDEHVHPLVLQVYEINDCTQNLVKHHKDSWYVSLCTAFIPSLDNQVKIYNSSCNELVSHVTPTLWT